MQEQIDGMQETIAHLIRAVDDLSEELHNRSNRIDLLERQVESLRRQIAAQDEAGGSAVLADRPPPHW